MNASFSKAFVKQLNGLRDKQLADAITRVIEDVERANRPSEIGNIKKLKGHKTAYRVRCGSYRIGLFIEKEVALFATVLPRKDIYTKFP